MQMVGWVKERQRHRPTIDRTKHGGSASLTLLDPPYEFPIRSAFLAAGLFDLRAALADLELRVALANHIDSAATLHDLAIGVAVLERANAADNFHRIGLLFGEQMWFSGCLAALARAEYTKSYETFNASGGGYREQVTGDRSFWPSPACARNAFQDSLRGSAS